VTKARRQKGAMQANIILPGYHGALPATRNGAAETLQAAQALAAAWRPYDGQKSASASITGSAHQRVKTIAWRDENH